MRRLSILFIFFFVVHISYSQKGRIAVFGSSVANGSGDTTGAGGYAGLLKEHLGPQGWEVINVSKGGDNTSKILSRFEDQLLPLKPDIVVIGLSLGNEGINNPTELGRARIFEKFRSGILHLIRLCNENHFIPVVVNCYARNDFGQEQYEATKKMNLVINTWDVASINVLGTIDNGNGQWAEGFYHDRSHPNFAGHREMFHAFVPGLFDALKAGKPNPEPVAQEHSIQLNPGSILVYRPDEPLWSFSVSYKVKPGKNGLLSRLAGKNSSMTVRFQDGKIGFYDEKMLIAGADTLSESKGWQYIVITYSHSRHFFSFYLNSKLLGTLQSEITPGEIILGNDEPVNSSIPDSGPFYKDLLIYRSSLNQDEVTALYQHQLLQSSLDIYAPLNDSTLLVGENIENRAQSKSVVKLFNSIGNRNK